MSNEPDDNEDIQQPQEGAPIPSGHESDTGDGEEEAESGSPNDGDRRPGGI